MSNTQKTTVDFKPFEALFGTPTAASQVSDHALVDAFEKSNLFGAIQVIAKFVGGTHDKKTSPSTGITQHDLHEYTSKRGGLTFTSREHSFTLDCDYTHDVVISKGPHVLFFGQYNQVDPSVDEDGRSVYYTVKKLDAQGLLAAKHDIEHVLAWQDKTTHPHTTPQPVP